MEKMMELTDLLCFVEMFQGLKPRHMKKLADRFDIHRLEKDEVLFRQGDKAECLYIVQSGFVEVIIDGRIVGLLGKGQSIGEIAWLDRSVRSGTTRAVVNSVIACISFNSLNALCKGNSKLAHCIMKNIAADLSFRLRQRSKS